MSQLPQSPYKTFRLTEYVFDEKSGEVKLRYAFDDAITFEEVLSFPLPSEEMDASRREVIDRALSALHLACGVSYYKAFCPSQIKVESGTLTADGAAFWTETYTQGLGEFFYQNDLAFKDLIHFSGSEGTAGFTNDQNQGDGILLGLGGGKDSIVSAELLKRADRDFALFSLGAHEQIRGVAEKIEKELLVIERKLDPKLIELNKQGAYNGHVPISAIIAFAGVVLAALHGKRDVIVSNERSANFGNTVVDGVEINHQYSKSLAFETAFQAYLMSSVTNSVRYFSLLRPLSELRIAEEFAKLTGYDDLATSCNKNYRLSGPSELLWCGKCPKCAFVFALFAGFMDKERLVKMFGENLFDDKGLTTTYRQLLGLEGVKPFECVGTPNEMVAAFEFARRRGEFDDTFVMREIVVPVLDARTDLDAVIAKERALSKEHAMPEEYLFLYDALGA